VDSFDLILYEPLTAKGPGKPDIGRGGLLGECRRFSKTPRGGAVNKALLVIEGFIKSVATTN
jgi:hypothetical protein|tara:strand:+ start:834 stop:1019 length:186 start_codon:yes stop_codon:yes gene_type:complete